MPSAVDVILLVVAGLAGGMANSIAGGGSLIVFPAMMATGLPPLAANVTNSIGQLPSYVGGAFGFRAEYAGHRRRLGWLVAAAMLGSIVGSVLLLVLPAAAFDFVVPILVIAASVLLALQPRIKRWAAAHHPTGDAGGELDPTARPGPRALAAVFACAIYGGYFGGALGVILIGVLAVVLPDRLRRINAFKSLIALAVAVVTVLIFGLFGPVDWLAVVIVAPAALVGGVIGARIALRVRDDVLRWLVVVLGLGVAAYLGYRAVAAL